MKDLDIKELIRVNRSIITGKVIKPEEKHLSLTYNQMIKVYCIHKSGFKGSLNKELLKRLFKYRSRLTFILEKRKKITTYSGMWLYKLHSIILMDHTEMEAQRARTFFRRNITNYPRFEFITQDADYGIEHLIIKDDKPRSKNVDLKYMCMYFN